MHAIESQWSQIDFSKANLMTRLNRLNSICAGHSQVSRKTSIEQPAQHGIASLFLLLMLNSNL